VAEDRLLTPKEVAESLNRHEKSIIWWCREGYLPCKRFGKLWGVMDSDLEKWMADPPPYPGKGAVRADGMCLLGTRCRWFKSSHPDLIIETAHTADEPRLSFGMG
jgi:excisionase family DNA binding protein